MSHTVLYIDDSDDNLVLVERILRPRGDVRLRVAQTGRDGVEAAIGDPPNLILLDNRLPDSSGLQVLGELAASPTTAAVPVVVFSGDTGQRWSRNCSRRERPTSWPNRSPSGICWP
ncbi:MAG TPA: response regulator [Streptosporangiaceae bacterium]|nr:response regulator [Streptosporangiaceae bacterium]